MLPDVQRVLIAGCGYVGCAVGRELIAQGCEVFGLRRNPHELPHGIAALRGDLLDSSSLASLPTALDFVVYTAGPAERSEEAYRSAYVRGLGNLLRALSDRKSPPQRFLFTSSTAVYGQDRGEWVDEDSEVQPQGFNGRVLLEAEETLKQSRIPGVVLRLGGIYGPGRTGLLRRARDAAVGCVSGVHHFTNRIHRDDVVGALCHLMHIEHPDFVYIAVDGEPSCACEIRRWIEEQRGNAGPAREAGRVARARLSGKRCRSGRLVASGYRFRYATFRDGYAELLRAD